MFTARGLMLVMSGPSGAGKGSVRKALLEKVPVRYGVSATTRDPRPGEKSGRDYHFVSTQEFRRWIRQGKLCEWAEVYGHLYGTPREPMLTWLKQGYDVIVEKDVVGAKSLRKEFPEAVFVFIMPPSTDELRRRVTERGTEGPEDISRRLSRADSEMDQVLSYDYVITNHDVNESAETLRCIMVAEKCRTDRVRVGWEGSNLT